MAVWPTWQVAISTNNDDVVRNYFSRVTRRPVSFRTNAISYPSTQTGTSESARPPQTRHLASIRREAISDREIHALGNSEHLSKKILRNRTKTASLKLFFAQIQLSRNMSPLCEASLVENKTGRYRYPCYIRLNEE